MATTSIGPRTLSAVAIALVALLLATPRLVDASGPDGEVRGYVTDAISGAPVSGASVRLDPFNLARVFEVTTDATGHYSAIVPPHWYQVLAFSSAHVPAVTDVGVGSGLTAWANVTLTAAGNRSALLRGFVTDGASGGPVTTGRMLASAWQSYPLPYQNSSSIDASGYFEMRLVPNSYELATKGLAGYDAFTASIVSLGGGEVRWNNVTLTPNPVNAWINGTVYDAWTFALIPGAVVTVRVDGLPFGGVVADANGTYAILVQSGWAEVVADAPGYAPTRTSRAVSGPGTTVVDLDLEPLKDSVRGYVRDGVTGAPLAGTVVSGTPSWGSYYDHAVTDASGYYELWFPDDMYTIAVEAPGYAFWDSTFYPDTTTWTNVTLWPLASVIQGYVIDGTDGSHLRGFGVDAIDARTGHIDRTVTDANGSFTLVLPPSLAITVSVGGYSSYAANITYAETRPFETSWVNLTLSRALSRIRATLTDALTGAPIPAASVTVWWSSALAYEARTNTTDGAGVALLEITPGSTGWISADAPGYLPRQRAIDVRPGANDASLSLYPDLPVDVTVRGYVTDVAGAPFWLARVQATGFGTSVVSTYTNVSGYFQFQIVASPQTIEARKGAYTSPKITANPSSGETIWVNVTMSQDSADPRITRLTATPSVGISTASPSAVLAHIEEGNLATADLSPLMLHSAAAGIGTFLPLERFPDADVLITRAPGNYTVSSSWDTTSPIGWLSDGTSSLWWPVVTGAAPFVATVDGSWDNASLPSPIDATATFDVRDGRLLYILVGSEFVGPRDQPAGTFAPYDAGYLVDLSSTAYVGSTVVTGPAFAAGALTLTVYPSVPSGPYGMLLEALDSVGRVAVAFALMDAEADTDPPSAAAGPDISVDEDIAVLLDGSTSEDNVRVADYMWTITDGAVMTRAGAVVAHEFATPGTYVVTLTVWDAQGNTATDALTVTVLDVTNPTVSIQTPAEGETVSGSVYVATSVADNVEVVRVEFLLDSALIGEDTTAPFGFSVPLGNLTVGVHTIEVVAYDDAGNFATSSRQVRIAPPGETLDLLPIILTAAVGIAIAAATGTVLLWRRRRRPAPPVDTESDPPLG
ncbi:MAG TPA: carboxypeptidase regulatory-like domain-containing protein [Thermoplasmata archaeon]|nr:carboxypeptidase regulatory-like domain-containing protein [Thermoplasmata archaeon]